MPYKQAFVCSANTTQMSNCPLRCQQVHTVRQGHCMVQQVCHSVPATAVAVCWDRHLLTSCMLQSVQSMLHCVKENAALRDLQRLPQLSR